jgi:hypothetical protein
MVTDENMGNYGHGKIPKFDDDEPTLIQFMANAISSYYKTSGTQKLFECDKPGHTFGWKIDSKGVRLVECGCYNEAVWPAVLSLGLGPIIKNIGQSVAPKIVTKINKKLMKEYINATRKTIADIFEKINNSIDIAVQRVLARGVRQQELNKLVFGELYPDIVSQWTNKVAESMAMIRGYMEAMLDDDYIMAFLDKNALDSVP